MISTLEIDGRSLYPIREAVQETTYSRDYITRLAREGKIIASYVGRQWFVDLHSLKQYAENAALEQEVRKRQLSEERKRERQLREATEHQHTLRLKKASTLNVRAFAAASLVLAVGLFSGVATYQVMYQTTSVSLPVVVSTQPAQVSRGYAAADEMGQSRNSVPVVEVPTYFERPLSDAREGVFLLSAAGSIEDVTTLFSDVVEVRQMANGMKVVVPVDAAGNQVGNEVPFVVVPVVKE